MPVATATKIAHWLKARQDQDSGRVVDSVHQVSGSYADGFAALTFAMLGWAEPLGRALEISLARPLDSEFDGLAQALIARLAPQSLNPQQSAHLKARPSYQGDQLVSNNWALFRALTRELCGQVGDFSRLERQLPGGLFPDSPVGQATPTCYHAKICAVLALQAQFSQQSSHKERLLMGLEALLALISPQGALAPYGRSRNTLFGYGSAYLALRLGAQIFEDGRFAWGATRALRFLLTYQAADGHIPASLNSNEWLRQDWDVYINNPDYNAFAAACLLMAERLAPNQPPETEPAQGVSDLGPLLAVRHQGQYFACSTSGEFAPYGSPFFCDLRYAGMSPLVFDDGNELRFFDQNYCWDGRDRTRPVLGDPAACNWVPYLALDSMRYWVRCYEPTGWTWENGRLNLKGCGAPSRPVPRKGWQRYLESKLWRRPARQMELQTLSDSLEVSLEMDFHAKSVRLWSKCSNTSLQLKRNRLEETLCPA